VYYYLRGKRHGSENCVMWAGFGDLKVESFQLFSEDTVSSKHISYLYSSAVYTFVSRSVFRYKSIAGAQITYCLSLCKPHINSHPWSLRWHSRYREERKSQQPRAQILTFQGQRKMRLFFWSVLKLERLITRCFHYIRSDKLLQLPCGSSTLLRRNNGGRY
jgi:hypothetical protein